MITAVRSSAAAAAALASSFTFCAAAAAMGRGGQGGVLALLADSFPFVLVEMPCAASKACGGVELAPPRGVRLSRTTAPPISARCTTIPTSTSLSAALRRHR